MMLPLGEKGAETHIQGSLYEETPLGYAIALYTSKKEIPIITIYTDMDHHSGLIAATYDYFKNEESDLRRDCFQINNSKV